MAALVRPASTALAIVAGLSIGPWLLFALLLPAGNLTWVGFGLDGVVLVLLTVCRTKATPLPWPRATWLSLSALAISSLLRFIALPLWPTGAGGGGAEPSLEAFGEQIQTTLNTLAAITLLHLCAAALLAGFLAASLLKQARR